MQINIEGINGNYERFLETLNVLIGGKRNSFIDLGCCHATVTGLLTDFKERKYIDILPRVLDYPDEQKYFEEGDILKLNIDKHYDVSFALDVPEHIYKEDGWKLYDIMSRISDRVICFTPLDEWMMTDESDKNPESHRSIWRPEDLDDTWVKIVFPVYHPALNIGAWFYMKCENPSVEFERIQKEINIKVEQWVK